MKRKNVMAVLLMGVMALQGICQSGCGGTVQETEARKAVEEQTAARTETATKTEAGPGQEAEAEMRPLSDTETQIQPAAEEEGEMGTVQEALDSAVRYQDGPNGFAFRFTKELLSEKQEGANMVASPYSVWLPLAALVSATDEGAREQFANALGEDGMDAAALNEAAAEMLDMLEQKERAAWMKENGMEYESPLKIANALFVSHDSEVNREFEKIFEDCYEGKIFSVDFTKPQAAEKVNRWAAEKTDNKIEKLIDSFDPGTVAAIANAVFFSDSWTTKFPEENTGEELFYGAGGEETVPFMNRTFPEVQYLEDEEKQAVLLGTQSGGQMILLLPEEGTSAEELLEGMDAEGFEQLVSAPIRTVELSLPKFKLASGTFSVKEALERLGVPVMGGRRTLLNGLAEGESLVVSDAVQKAMVEVDEEGMTAAAVTVIAMARGAMLMEQEPVVMKCDRPFAFLLTADGGDRGQIVLFSGIVNQIGE